jgi:eukaryotic-like serine/threonine-protein kinase
VIQAGQVLNERYKLVRPLGQGSQAFVWVAEHLALGSQVAVKLIDPELAKQEDARQRFAREATAAAKLRSAHVVQMLDHGIEGEQPFIVMELLDGEDLFDRLDRKRKLTIQETSRVVTQVSRALMRAHAEGIIHRDLKPENVFLVRNEDDELAKVLDFGVAKVVTPAKQVMVRTGVGTLIGTPHYMSPEQVKGITEIDHRSDLWSLGVIAYQCVTGQLPFDSEGVGDLLIKITLHEPVKPSTLSPELPHSFDEWFKKACAKEPDQRFQTAREMADALVKLTGEQVRVSQPGRVLVSLADSNDLDWGSLAGVRIPAPPRRAMPTIGDGETHLTDADINLVESKPPPSDAPPLSENPFLKPTALAPPSAPSRPMSNPPSSRQSLAPQTTSPPSARGGVGTTVTGLSTSPPAHDFEAEGGKRRRAMWFVALAVVAIGGLVAAMVIRSRGGFDSGQSSVATTAKPTQTGTTSPTAAPAPLSASAATGTVVATSRASSTSEAVDPTVTKKPASAKPATPVGTYRPQKKEENGAVIIELPSPDRDVPLGPKR